MGWRFNIGAVSPPPSTVLAIRLVGDESNRPYLVPARQGNWNVWSWASGPFEEPNPDYTHLWRRLVEMHDGQTFEVVRTRGVDGGDVRQVH